MIRKFLPCLYRFAGFWGSVQKIKIVCTKSVKGGRVAKCCFSALYKKIRNYKKNSGLNGGSVGRKAKIEGVRLGKSLVFV